MLQFKAAPGKQTFVPDSRPAKGQAARLVGLRFDKDAINPITGKSGAFVDGEPYSCAPGSRAATRLEKLARRGEVLPADEATAKACGLAFEKSIATKGRNQ
jgi:hypothetical protein